MIDLSLLPGAPFAAVLDVGGNLGDFAAAARAAWPSAEITSFEPIPELAKENRRRAQKRWFVEQVAVSALEGRAEIGFCVNQHTASTMQKPGTARRELFGIRDRFEQVEVKTMPLDAYITLIRGRTLLKIDVEGHEGKVLRGAQYLLQVADLKTVVVEVQNNPTIFEGAPPPIAIDMALRAHGFFLHGLADALLSPAGGVAQFDAIYHRA